MKKIYVILLTLICLMGFGLSYNKVEAAEEISKVTGALATDGSSDGVYVMTAVNGSSEYYVPNVQASAGGVTAESFSSSTLKDAMYWNFTYDSTNTCWKITSYTTSTNYLRFNTTNNGVNVGSTDSNNKYTITWSDTNSSYEVKESNGRKLALYGTSNWRCYTSTSGIQKINLYKVTITQDSLEQTAVDAVNPKMSMSFKYTQETTYSGDVAIKYTKVTSVDELTDGTQVYLVGTSADGTVNKVASGKGGSKNDYLAVEDANIDSNGYLTPSSTYTPVTLNVSGTGYTIKLGDEYIGSTSVKSLTFSSTTTEPTVWSISIDATDDNKAVIKISDTNVLQYNQSSPRFTTYNNTGDGISLYKATQVQASTTTYSDVEFRVKCGINITATDALFNLEDADSYGIYVTDGTSTQYFDISGTTGYHEDTTNSLYYVVISLGDVLNNIDRATTEFTIGAYVKKTSESSYVLSSTTKTYSVAKLVEEYSKMTGVSEAVSDLHNILSGKGCYKAQ